MTDLYYKELKPEDFFHVEYNGNLEYRIPQELIDAAFTDPNGNHYSLTINWDEEYPLLYPGVINNMFTITSVYDEAENSGYPTAWNGDDTWTSSPLMKVLGEDLYEFENGLPPYVKLSNKIVPSPGSAVNTMQIDSYYKYDSYNKKVIVSNKEQDGFRRGLPTPLYPDAYNGDEIYFKSESSNPFFFYIDSPLQSVHPIFGEDGRYYFEVLNEE